MGGCRASSTKDPNGESIRTPNIPTIKFFYNGVEDATIFSKVRGPLYDSSNSKNYVDEDGISYVEWEFECLKSISLKNINTN